MQEKRLLSKINTIKRKNECGINGCSYQTYYIVGKYIKTERKTKDKKNYPRISICKECNYCPELSEFVYFDKNKLKFIGKTTLYAYNMLDKRVKIYYNK